VRILVADYNPVERARIKGLLVREGHEVQLAENGAECWSILQSTPPPQLAILDWQMPGLNGLEVCQRLRQLEHGPYVFVILLTSNDQRHQELEGLRAGADDYLTKPLDPGLLRARLTVGQRILELQAKLMASEENLRFQANHDSLTGLHNRAGTLDQLAREISRAKRDGAPFGVIIGDVDHFKSINDTHGHAAGDRALCEVARRIASSVRLYDTVGRLGGEEFLILLPGCDASRTLIQAERLRESIGHSPVDVDGLHLPITASLGAASFNPLTSEGAVALVARADQAMYQAKNSGRNRVSSAPPETDVHVEYRGASAGSSAER